MLILKGVNSLAGSKNLADSSSTDRLVTGETGLSHLSFASCLKRSRTLCSQQSCVIASQLHKLQFGFLKGKSTTAQLLQVLHNIGEKLDKGVQVDAIYLEFAKAFDRLNHKLLLKKVHRFGIHGTLLS